MKILLIQPKMKKRPMDTDLKTQMSPSLGLFTLLNLTPLEHEVQIINENIEKISFDYPADMVAITVTVDVFPRARKIAEKFQKRGIPVVAGGIHITCSPNDCISYFDALCVGPAERVWAKILTDISGGNLKKIYHDADGFRGEEIVSPKYSQLVRKKYLFTNIVLTSRGCPNRCDFCYNSCKNRFYVTRPISDVINDIKALNTNHVYFVDDNFVGDPEYTYSLLKELKKMNIKWNAAVTTKILNHLDLLDFMVETGCQSLFIGFESINDTALHGVHKDNHSQQYGDLVDELHKRRIMINASMVFGLDGDGPEAFQNSLNWLIRSKIATLTAHILTPYPGTNLYERMEKAGRITDTNLENYNTAHVVFNPLNISKKELYEGYLKIYDDFYSFKNIWRRKPENYRQIKPYFLFNLLYRKFGRAMSQLTHIIPMNLFGRLSQWLSYKF
jgi:radical SAM superfamily enzyme YgiQ (UPF0313 family)